MIIPVNFPPQDRPKVVELWVGIVEWAVLVNGSAVSSGTRPTVKKAYDILAQYIDYRLWPKVESRAQ